MDIYTYIIDAAFVLVGLLVFLGCMPRHLYRFSLPPQPITVTNEGFFYKIDSLYTKNGRILGGDWNPGWGGG